MSNYQLIADGEITSWQKVGAKVLSGAIFGGVAGATLNVGLAGAISSASTANVVGGIAERTIDGDSTTSPTNGTDVLLDAVTGGIGGYVGNKVLIYARDELTYAARQGAFEAWEAISGGPFKTLEKQFLNEALRKFAIERGVLGGLRTAINNGWTVAQVQTSNLSSTSAMTGIQVITGSRWFSPLSTHGYSELPKLLTPEEACRKYGGNTCN